MSRTLPTDDATRQAWIDQVVRLVMQRLDAIGATDAHAAVPAAARASRDAEPQPGTLRVSDRLLTVDSLRGRWSGLRTLEVPGRAVLTPSLRDELRDRGVRVVHYRQATAAAVPNAKRLTPCFVQGSRTKLDAQLMGLALDLRPEDRGDWSSLRSAVASAASQAGRAIVVALEPYVAVCELNRDATLRAGYAPTTTALAKLMHQLRPNVVVVDARRYTHATLKTVLDEFELIPPDSSDGRS